MEDNLGIALLFVAGLEEGGGSVVVFGGLVKAGGSVIALAGWGNYGARNCMEDNLGIS